VLKKGNHKSIMAEGEGKMMLSDEAKAARELKEISEKEAEIQAEKKAKKAAYDVARTQRLAREAVIRDARERAEQKGRDAGMLSKSALGDPFAHSNHW